MIDHATYLAALDRLRRVKAKEDACKVYQTSYMRFAVSDIRKDKALVYDAEHDPTPATVEWLREVLGEPIEECCDEITYEHCTLWLDDDGSLESVGFECSMFTNPTRGDVLRLRGVFGAKS